MRSDDIEAEMGHHDRPSAHEDRHLPNRAQGTPQGPTPGDVVPEPAPPLEGGEELLTALRGIGSVMFLTSARIIVARHGLERRPRSGIQAFPLGDIREIRIERGSGPSGRVVVATGRDQEVVSMFFEPRSLDRARELIAAARLQIARLRRIAAKGSGGPTGLIGRS